MATGKRKARGGIKRYVPSGHYPLLTVEHHAILFVSRIINMSVRLVRINPPGLGLCFPNEHILFLKLSLA